MFYWKNVVVLIGLLGIASVPAYMLLRSSDERALYGRLILAAIGIVVVALSPIPMIYTLIIYGLLMVVASPMQAPRAGTYLFFFLWVPAAAAHFGFSGLYIGVIDPDLIFAFALLAIFIISPAQHGRRGIDSSDIWLLSFLTIFWICASLRGTWTDAARLLIGSILTFGISYQVLSRLRIANAELVLRLFVYAAAATSLLCIFETVMHWPLYAALKGLKSSLLENVPRMMLFRAGIVRAYGPFSHPLAGSAVFGMAGVAYFALYQIRGRSLPLLTLGVMMLLGLIATVSRTGILAFSAGIATFAILRGRKGIAAIMVAGGLVLLLATPILSQADAQGSASYRYSLMIDAPRLLGNHVWLGYREAVSDGTLEVLRQGQGIVDLVNVFASLIVYGGIVSLVAYIGFLATTISRYRALLRAKPNREQLLLGQTLLSMQVGYLAMAPVIGSWSTPMLLSCLWIGLLAALGAEARRFPTADPQRRPAPAQPIGFPAFDQLPALR